MMNSSNTNKMTISNFRTNMWANAQEFEKGELDRMLLQRVIAPAQTWWAAPIVFAPKKYGSLRFCVDYRKRNAVTKPDSYPIPWTDAYIDSLGEAAVLSTLHINSGYRQVRVKGNNWNKTALVFRHALYVIVQMSLRLKNAPRNHLACNGCHSVTI